MQWLCCMCATCIPCGCSWYAPCGDYYLKIGEDCGPCCIVPNEDGTFSDGCCTTYKKAPEAAGAPPSSMEMTR